jgi:pyridinium-3,5-bisthiocarboxylic acid mononucleotide nickel chelatase
MTILKIEPFSGLSGDMFLGALAEITNSWDELIYLPGKLGLKNVDLKISNVEKAGIACKHIKIVDHNFYNLSPIKGIAKIEHEHSESDHNHKHDDSHHHHTNDRLINPIKINHEHHHRNLKDIYKIIDAGEISVNTKKISQEIFLLLGQAEAKVHGLDINIIHFHEVGAIDSIIDIVGTAYLLDKLNVQKSYSLPICTGFGFVMTEHGKLPVPTPATKELLLGFPTYAGETQGEMTTPTGAAILRYLNPEFTVPALVEEKVGHGPGEKNFIHPNVLRLTLCELKSDKEENIFILETNIDDMSSELIGIDFQQQLFNNGALDFYFTQVVVKKGRPGIVLSVIVKKNDINTLSDFLLENTTSIGLRYYPVKRKVLSRKIINIETSLGNAVIKEITLPSGKVRMVPEYESCSTLAKTNNLPIMEVFIKINSELINNDYLKHQPL